MRKIRKIVALALATMMMMAMSITAFAEEATTASTISITVNNLSADEDTTVSIYKIAEINQDEWSWSTWVTDELRYLKNTTDTEYTFEYDKMKEAVASVNPDDTKTTSNGATTLVFNNNLKAGAYLVIATGDKTEYQTMVAKTYGYNETTSVFEAKSATVVAKTSTTIVTKETDDTFVSADELVTFTITSVVPYIADDAKTKTFIIYDKPTGLKNLALTSVKVGNDTVTATLADAVDGVYSIDLTNQLTTANIGKKVVLTLTANVDGAAGYENTAWSNRMDDEDDYSTVKGYTGSFTLTKVDAQTTTKTLAGAKFSVAATNGGAALKFVKVTSGVFTLVDTAVTDDLEDDEVFDELEVAANGTLKVQGLAEGTYYITETQAPEGYSINDDIAPVSIAPEYVDATAVVPVAKGHVDLTGAEYYVKDTQLISLPFTGGMGTTIFTVLGVAIMVLAAALYFVSKRRAAR